MFQLKMSENFKWKKIIIVINFYGLKSLAHFNALPICKHWYIA